MIITAADLWASGAVIQALFAQQYPKGLTERQMEREGKKYPWVMRALERWREIVNIDFVKS